MNSLNILSKNIGATPPPSPRHSRTSSQLDLPKTSAAREAYKVGEASTATGGEDGEEQAQASKKNNSNEVDVVNEKTPLLNGSSAVSDQPPEPVPGPGGWWLIPKQAAGAVVGTVRIIFATIVAPGQYIIACFYDDYGRFSTFMPLRRIQRKFRRGKGKSGAHPLGYSEKRLSRRSSHGKSRSLHSIRRSPSTASSASSVLTTDSEFDSERPPTRDSEPDSPSRHTRSKALAMTSTLSEDSGATAAALGRRSIRIKVNNEESLKQRRQQKRLSQHSSKASSASRTATSDEEISEAAAAALKSPTSPLTGISKATRYPRAPAPPGPLVPLRRQPSYSALPAIPFADRPSHHQKTLILDLDETLIHSMSKGGRFTTGHMVEVKLHAPLGVAGGSMYGPQVPILYYVHKRPFCDDFLRKVCKWYNLVVFTAAVQEYADPVIDWLELERKYFSARYYRQHCTFRNSAYIKDLAQVEPDLSKVLIVDNSPLSYAFHEDNAIPIEGWISDPTDNDLLHLIPLLEGLQYVTDVRALLALRKGQPATA